MTEDFGFLNIHDTSQIQEYEQNFYQAYAKLVENKLVRQLWDWDDAHKRLKARIPYEDQIIYTCRNADGHLLMVMAVSTSTTQFQASAFGLHPAGAQYCEIINVISTAYLTQYGGLTYHSFIRDYGFCDLIARGYTYAYGTCTRRRLRPYLRLGAQLLSQTAIGTEERFFLGWNLPVLTARVDVLPAAVGAGLLEV